MAGTGGPGLLEAAGDALELQPLIEDYVRQAVNLSQSTVSSIEVHEATDLTRWQEAARRHDELVGRLRDSIKADNGG